MVTLKGTHAQLNYIITKMELDMAKEKGTAWHRSQERVPINFPFVGVGYLSNKKWPLNEESTKHINNSALCIECVNYV